MTDKKKIAIVGRIEILNEMVNESLKNFYETKSITHEVSNEDIHFNTDNPTTTTQSIEKYNPNLTIITNIQGCNNILRLYGSREIPKIILSNRPHLTTINGIQTKNSQIYQKDDIFTNEYHKTLGEENNPFKKIVDEMFKRYN